MECKRQEAPLEHDHSVRGSSEDVLLRVDVLHVGDRALDNVDQGDENRPSRCHIARVDLDLNSIELQNASEIIRNAESQIQRQEKYEFGIFVKGENRVTYLVIAQGQTHRSRNTLKQREHHIK